MLSYQHIYHAGNFADVQKHAILAQVVRAMRLKPSPMAVMDTHAGRGVYDLSSTEAQKTHEFENGISHFWRYRHEASPLKPYFDVIKDLNGDDDIRHYPGSAMIARKLLKPVDRLVVNERHPGEAEELRRSFDGFRHTDLYQKDGLKLLPESVPFAERRGLVIIDPSFEIKTEYAEVPRAIVQAWKKWPQGVYFIWYPILPAGGHHTLLSALHEAGIPDILVSEINLEKPPVDHYRMTGSGIAIINPPWPEAMLADITKYVADHMPQKTTGEVFWLNNRAINPETGKLMP